MKRSKEQLTLPPIHAAAHALARALVLLCAQRVWRAPPGTLLSESLTAAAVGLLTDVSGAITHPAERSALLAQADLRISALRALLPLARDLNLATPAAAQQLGEEIAEIGRMVGGWRKRQNFDAVRHRRAPTDSREETSVPPSA